MRKELLLRSVVVAVLLVPTSLAWSYQYWRTPPKAVYLNLPKCNLCIEYGPHICNPTTPTYGAELLYRTGHHLPPGCCTCLTAILY